MTKRTTLGYTYITRKNSKIIIFVVFYTLLNYNNTLRICIFLVRGIY